MTTEELNALIAQAEGGDVSAMNQVAQVFTNNADFKDYEKAFFWYKKSAELGNVNSMSNLGGWCYLQGNGTEKNIPLADEWLKKAAENGWQWAWAFNEIANIFANDAQYKDLNKAFYWYSKSAEAGDALGMSNLGGWCYLWGNGTEKNLKLAVDWLEKAAEKDNMWSVCKLACDIYSQDNEFKDIDKALVCFEKIVVNSFAVAQPDYDRALKCLEKLAEEGNPKAICLMPKMIQDPFGGEHPDKWKWIEKAAEVGDAQCQYKVAEKMLSNNEDEAAYKWFAQSAKEGNADAAARLNELGAEYQFGNNGRTINLPLAYKFYEASADCGNSDGMANAAYCLSNGIGVEKDFKKCFELYSKAAELGNQFGYSNLGWCYMYGNGTEKDVEKAARWLTRAAEECNNIWSMNRLTEIYGGIEGHINHEQAAKWFLELIKRDCDPNSGVYENTGYNKDLYEKIKNAILNSKTEEEMMASLTGGSSGGSLLGGAFSITTSDAKNYINQAEEIIQRNENAKAAEAARKQAEAEAARRQAEEQARREREEAERRERERYEKFERNYREASGGSYRWEQELENETIVVPDGVTRIGTYAFDGCGMTEIIIPDSVTTIADGAFCCCFHLTSISMGKGIKLIGEDAFRGCKIKTFVIPDGMTSIGKSFFYGCSELTSVTIPNSVTSIGDHAFDGCKNLSSLVIPEGVTFIGNQAFRETGLTAISFPDSVTSIGKEVFWYCKSLKGVKFGKNVISIGEGAFDKGCNPNAIIVPKGTKQRFAQMEGLKGLEDKIFEE